MMRAEGLSLSKSYDPVNIDPARVVKTLTGLRPYRPAGYVVRREEFAGKVLVHNYGHGGCGVTLSWGCAEQAVKFLSDRQAGSVAVIGAGVIGLTTARVLQQNGWSVRVYADQFSPDTTSDVAGALWFPVTLYEEQSVSATFLTMFREAARKSYTVFRELMGEFRYGVYPMRFFELAEQKQDWPGRVEGNDLYPYYSRVSGDMAFNYPDGLFYEAMMIDPSLFLPALMDDIRDAGGQFIPKFFRKPEELIALEGDIVVNCTGYGAKALFGDSCLGQGSELGRLD